VPETYLGKEARFSVKHMLPRPCHPRGNIVKVPRLAVPVLLEHGDVVGVVGRCVRRLARVERGEEAVRRKDLRVSGGGDGHVELPVGAQDLHHLLASIWDAGGEAWDVDWSGKA